MEIDINKIEVEPIGYVDYFENEIRYFKVYYEGISFNVPYHIFCTQPSLLSIEEQVEVLDSHISLKKFEGLIDTIQNYIINRIKNCICKQKVRGN